MNTIPTYQVSLDNLAMFAIALVENPAIKSDAQLFSEQRYEFSVQDEEKRIVFGPIIRCDYPILRFDENNEPFNVVFSKEAAQKMVSDYLAMGYANNTNLGHTGFFPAGIEPLSFFFKDTNLGISPKGYEDIADGSAFAMMHVSNDDVWQALKDGTFKGFSIECAFDLQKDKFEGMTPFDVLMSILTDFQSI